MNHKPVFKSSQGRSEVLKVYDTILDKWLVPYEEMNINTSYGKTFIIKCGENSLPPLILLHGTSSNSVMWIDDIAEYSKYYCVYAIDIPGEPGKSEEKQYPLKGSTYFDWLNEVITVLQLKKVSFIGISLGAWMAAGFSSIYPQKADKLVLLCPSGIGSQRISFMFKALPLTLLGEWGFGKITRLVNGGQVIPKEALDYTKLIAKHFNLRTEPVPIYMDEELRQLRMPILLYAGDKDVLLNSKETIKRISGLLPHANVNLLTGYGHVLINLKREIIDFLLNQPIPYI